MSGQRHDVATTSAWTAAGTACIAVGLDSFTDADFDAPARLPGWERRHVVGHLARNAEALSRLVSWARSGMETPMYSDADQRADDIDRSAGFPVAQLREEYLSTARTLAQDMGQMSAEQWSRLVRSARGRPIPAAEVPWMRAREVWLHAWDLDLGPVALPGDFSCCLIEDVVEFFAADPATPPMRLRAGGREWSLGERGPVVEGEPAALALWLTGRGDGEDLHAEQLPDRPRWL